MSSPSISPEKLPVMVLAGATLFPRAFLPLHIFEPRYQAMLAEVLKGDRMFCIGTRREESESPSDVYPESVAGLVRACVQNPDGTSHLILEGIRRIRLTGFEQDTPFPIASVETIPSYYSNRETARELAGQLVEIVRSAIQPPSIPENEDPLHSQLTSVEDPEELVDLISYRFLDDTTQRQELIAAEDVNTRLEILIGALSSAL